MTGSKDPLRGVVEYDGTGYRGFQRLPKLPTVQGALEAALARIVGLTPVVGAGRTDAGVHARGQVISFSASWRRDLDELRRALNALLPSSIAVHDLALADPGFHARHCAVARWYRYCILNQPVRSPLQGRFAHHVPQRLDVDRCNALCMPIMGTHDFAAFASGPANRTVRTIHHAACTRHGAIVEFDVVISGAFAHLVRRLVGTVIKVGQGLLSPEGAIEILASLDRRGPPPPAPPHGLCLMEVFY